MWSDKLFSLLIQMKPRIAMLTWKKSITALFWFINGWEFKTNQIWNKNNEYYYQSDDSLKFLKFTEYIYEKTTGKDTWGKKWLFYHEAILEVVKGDEQAWVDLFFKLLDEFIEKEWIEIEKL